MEQEYNERLTQYIINNFSAGQGNKMGKRKFCDNTVNTIIEFAKKIAKNEIFVNDDALFQNNKLFELAYITYVESKIEEVEFNQTVSEYVVIDIGIGVCDSLEMESEDYVVIVI